MSQSKFEWKVGLFVFLGLLLLAGLMINFSKGTSLFKGTYNIYLRAQNVGGLKPQAGVLMSGVRIGSVQSAALSTNGTVLIHLEVYDDFKIDRSAQFMLDSMGFLGDQYVSIVSTNNTGDFIKDGDEVIAEAPLNLQEAMKSTAGLLQQAQTTMKTLDEAISNVNRMVLNETTLNNLSQSISNLQSISGNANQTLGKIDQLVQSNTPVINASVSNLHDFTGGLKSMLVTNQGDIAVAVQNLRSATSNLNELLEDVKATNGPAGLLLRDENMKEQLTSLVTNVNSMAEHFSLFSSNLNQRGIWSMLWKPKQPKRPKGD